jgi:tetratricopeptide (TPR) repeat protein
MKRVVSFLTIVPALVFTLAACRSAPVYQPAPRPQPTRPQPSVETPPPVQPAPTPQPAPTQPPPKQYVLGPASAALVSQAQTQAKSGNGELAVGTLERAMRIEPANPLLWIELGNVHEDLGHYPQADSMGRKALQLATGDPRAQAAAWRLIAESLRARNRNPEAAEADRKADVLTTR